MSLDELGHDLPLNADRAVFFESDRMDVRVRILEDAVEELRADLLNMSMNTMVPCCHSGAVSKYASVD